MYFDQNEEKHFFFSAKNYHVYILNKSLHFASLVIFVQYEMCFPAAVIAGSEIIKLFHAQLS